MTKAFNNYKQNGLLLTFENGNSISTIWDNFSYSENKDRDNTTDSEDAEVQVHCSNELLKELQEERATTDSVFGYLNINEWLDIVNRVAKE